MARARPGATCPTRPAATSTSCFRATRVCPDSSIDPKLQLAFYDGGLGSRAESEAIKITLAPPRLQPAEPGDGPRHNAEHHRLLRPDHPRLAARRPHLPVRLQPRRLHRALRRRRAQVLRHPHGGQARRGGCGRCSAIRSRRGASPTEAVKHVYQHGGSIKGDPLRLEREKRARKVPAQVFLRRRQGLQHGALLHRRVGDGADAGGGNAWARDARRSSTRRSVLASALACVRSWSAAASGCRSCCSVSGCRRRSMPRPACATRDW